MRTYLVTWSIDIDADTPEEAAEMAYAIQRDPNSVATFFQVMEGDVIAPQLHDIHITPICDREV